MKKLHYRKMLISESDKINDINPRHYIKDAWRLVNNKRQLVEINYLEEGWPEGYDRYKNEFIRVLGLGGCAYGAFDDKGLLQGYALLNKETFGKSYKYMLLDSLFVSYDLRGHGIGKKLLDLTFKAAKESGGEKVYICAGSASDTISFYRNYGCIDALDINEALYELDKRDLQLEYIL